MEDTRWTLRVTAVQPSGSVIHARKHSFAAGVPLSFDAEYDAVSALEVLLGAVGADLVGGIQTVARRRRVEIDDIEAVVQGTLHNPMVYLRVVGEVGDAGIRAIEARVYISSLDDDARVRAVWQEVLDTSPLVNTLNKAVKLELSYQQVL
jgi:uncharacterized OsmC-like protein